MTDEEADRYVLLADVEGSRRIDDRTAFESDLEAAFEAIDRTSGRYFSTPLTPMKGIDEFGCVLTDVAPVVDVVTEILVRTHPVGVRFAVSDRGIDVGLGRGTVAEMDGPAFHHASELLETLKDEELYVSVEVDEPYDDLASTALNLLTLRALSLTSRQVEVIRAYERHGTQPKAAEALGVSQQAISKTLRKADYDRMKSLREKARRGIKNAYNE